MSADRLARIAVVPLALVCSDPILALAADQEPPGMDVATNSIQEVVVTAQRRSEGLQNVPMSITALTAETLQNKAVRSFMDYGPSIPNLGFGYTGDGIGTGRTISIRGIAGNGTTGFYIDETPLEDSIDPRIVDVERIEVLRGPQGTLYGARSEGGTVRVITEQPSVSELQRSLHVSLSDTWNTDRPNSGGDFMLNIPLTESAAVRVVGLYDYQAGYFSRSYCKDAATAGVTCFPATSAGAGLTNSTANVASTTVKGVSGSLLLKVTDQLTITPRVLYQRSDYSGLPSADVFAGGSAAGYPIGPTPAAFSLPPLSPENFTQRRFFNVGEGGHDAWTLLTLNLKYEIATGEFTSATSYFDREVSEREDQTDYLYATLLSRVGLPPVANAITEEKSYSRFVQELRFTSAFSGPWQIVSGFFYSQLQGAIPFASRFPPSIVPGLDAALGVANPAVPDEFIAVNYHTRVQEPALYSEASYMWSARWKATLGLRWYRVSTTAGGWQEGLAVGGPRITDPVTTFTESGVSPKVAVDYRIDPSAMIYASVAKGFRPGGLVPSVPISPALGCGQSLQQIGLTPEATRRFASDSLYNYEVGAKTNWLANRLTLDLAAFHIQWNNLQQQILLSCGFGYTANAGAARSDGFEVELHARPQPGLDLSAGAGYQHARITQASSGGALSPQQPGDPVYMAPDWTMSTAATYTLALPHDRVLVTSVDAAYVGARFSGNNTPLTPRILPGYHLLNGRLALQQGHYELALVGKNLTNTHADLADSRSIAAEVPGRPRLLTNSPRTVGLEFRSTF